GQGSEEGIEQHPRGSRGVVGNDRVVNQIYVQRVLQRNSGTVPSGDIVDDDVVLQRHAVPGGWLGRYVDDSRTVHVLRSNTAAAARFRCIALDQVSFDE